MESKPLIIYYNDADGAQKIRCKVPKWQFYDKAMSVGEQYITFNLTSEVPVPFAVGDYCIYRGIRFYLNNLPTMEQKAGVRKSGEAFKYDTVRLDSDSEKLGRAIMLDITPTTGDYVAAKGTNFTGSADFQLFCGETKVTVNGEEKILTPVCTLANKIQANLDRAFPDDGWHVHVNLASTTTKYGRTILATHTDDKVLSFNGTTVAAALAEVNNTFDLDYFVKGRDIYIGYTLSSITAKDTSVKEDTSDDIFFYFGYGKGYADEEHQGKALFDIKRNANANQNIITRLRAMGSTRNMPYRYYNKKYDLPQSLFPTNLQLPDTFETPDKKAENNKTRKAQSGMGFLRDVKGDTNDSYIDKNDDATKTTEGLREGRAMWDGSDSNLEEIYPTIKEGTYRDLRAAEQQDSQGYTEKSTAQTDGNGKHSFINYTDDERVDEVLAVGEIVQGALSNDANIGKGIDEDPAASAQGYVDIPYDMEGNEYLVSNASVRVNYREAISNSTIWQYELGTIDDQYAGAYTLAPSFPGNLKIGIYRPSIQGPIQMGYVLSVYATPKSGGEEYLAYIYGSDNVTLDSSKEYTELTIDSIPIKGKSITLAQNCSVRIVLGLQCRSLPQNSPEFDLSFYVGKSKQSPSTETKFSAQFRWGPVEQSSEYLNTPFHIIIKDMGFDLKAQFNSQDEPTVEMQDGMCVGRKFKIGDDVQKVTYTKNGKQYIGYQLSLTRAQDTSIHKYYPSETDPIQAGDHYILTGIQMPDVYVKMAEVRLLVAATQYLADNSETKYTYEPSIDNIYLTRNYDRCKAEGDVTKSVYWNLYAGLKFPFRGLPETGADDETLPFINITIETLTIKEEDGYTPQVEMTLNDDIEQSTYNKITTAVDRIYNGSLMNEFMQNASLNGTTKSDMIALIQEQGKQRFISKTKDDTAKGNLTFEKDLDVQGTLTALSEVVASLLHSSSWSKEINGGSGFGIWLTDGNVSNAIFDNITVRGKWTAALLEIMKLSYSAGNITIDGAGATLYAVVPFTANGQAINPETKNFLSTGGKIVKNTDGKLFNFSATSNDIAYYRCYFKASDGDRHIDNEWQVGDYAKCQTFNLTDGEYKNAANRLYQRLVINTGTGVKYNGIDCHFVDLANTATATILGTTVKVAMLRGVTNDVPQAGDMIAHVGNAIDTTRQGAIQLVAIGEDAPAINIYGGINTTTEDMNRFLRIKLSPKQSYINTNFFTFTNGDHSAPAYIQCGAWYKGVTAHRNEIWQHNGSSWVCEVDDTTEEPSEDSTAWQIFATKGKDGIDGQSIKGDDGKAVVISPSAIIITERATGLTANADDTYTANSITYDLPKRFQVMYNGEAIALEASMITWTAQNPYSASLKDTVKIIKADPVISSDGLTCTIDDTVIDTATLKANTSIDACSIKGTLKTGETFVVPIVFNRLGSVMTQTAGDITTTVRKRSESYIDNNAVKKADFTSYQEQTADKFKQVYTKEEADGKISSEVSQSAEEITAKVGDAGIDITEGKIKLSAENTEVSGDFTVQNIKTDDSKGNGHVETHDGQMNFYNALGNLQIQFGIVDGYLVLRYYDNDGTLLYDLGPTGMTARNIVMASVTEQAATKITTTKKTYNGNTFDTADNGYFYGGSSLGTIYLYTAAKIIKRDASGNTTGTVAMSDNSNGRQLTAQQAQLADGKYFETVSKLRLDATATEVDCIKSGTWITGQAEDSVPNTADYTGNWPCKSAPCIIATSVTTTPVGSTTPQTTIEYVHSYVYSQAYNRYENGKITTSGDLYAGDKTIGDDDTHSN